jgi:predicted CXXCH cytochrome family protein
MRGIARLALVAYTLMLAGCLDERIVWRDRPLFEDPPAAAGGFLGYSDAATSRTVCGNCHVGKQRQWAETAHAGAWATLQASGASRTLCEACHSVSSLGNVVSQAEVGWVSTAHERYQDVQCESCHGPGLEHVLNPDADGNKPYAPLAVGLTLGMGCGECHSGAHRPFAEEWSASRHARIAGTRGTNPSCVACHEARGVLDAWGINTSYLEQSGAAPAMAITCTVCHDPHDNRHQGQLRFSMDTTDPERNLCMKCHNRRAEPLVTSAQGPHSPQGPVLLGNAGWIPPGFQWPAGALVGTHGSDANPRLCASCHVNSYQVRDAITGAFTFRATGHSFQAIPCVDAQGIPTGQQECAITERSFQSCTSCHASPAGARSALIVARTRIQRLVDEIQPMIAQIPASEFSTTDNRISTGEGARFNMQLAQERGSPAHNPFLIEALLIASIRQIELDYGIPRGGTVSLSPELVPSSGGQRARAAGR